MDASNEPKHAPTSTGQARRRILRLHRILARRLAERGVRFPTPPRLGSPRRGQERHHHFKAVDQGSAALIQDLKQRGMLTTPVRGGEFGRTPWQGNGRDHHIKGFSIWMAGGGIKAESLRQHDEFGYNAEENGCTYADFHANASPTRHSVPTFTHSTKDSTSASPGWTKKPTSSRISWPRKQFEFER